MSINNNFYEVINSLVSQGAGSELVVTDHKSFIDYGKQLDKINGTEIANNFLSALANRIAQVVELYRGYNGDFTDLYRGNIEYGQTMEQIMFQWYDSTAAGWTQLNDGETFGAYTISKPQIAVNYYEKENSYDIEKTIQFEMLKKAFTSEAEMSSFMSGIFGMFTNSNELIREEARLGMIAGAIMKQYTGTGSIKATSSDALGGMYNLRECYATDTGDTTLNNAAIEVMLNNEKFIKYTMATIKKVKKKMTKPSTKFSSSRKIKTFTPENAQQTYLAAGLKTAIDSYIINTAHYPEGADVLNLDAKSVAYWQSAASPYDITTNNPSVAANISITLHGVVGIVFDDWACGEYTSVQTMDISPYDAKHRCWQYIYHGLCRYVVNQDANFVVFYIPEPTTSGS